MHLTEAAPDWQGHSNYDRTHKCRVWLYVHGFLSDAENRRVKKRIHSRDNEDFVADPTLEIEVPKGTTLIREHLR